MILLVGTGWATFSQMKSTANYFMLCQEEFMRELRESQHMQVVSSFWRAGSDVEETVRVVRLQCQTTAHAMHCLPSPAAHISCT